VEGDEDDGEDVLDKMINRLEEKVEKGTDIERLLEERERKQREKEEERERREREKEEEEERREREKEEEEKRREEREERAERYEEMVMEKYERGEELTAKEKYALSLILENEQIEVEKQQMIAECDAKIAAEKEAKKAKRKEMLSKVGKAIGSIASSSSSSSSSATTNSQSNTSPQKTVRKVWTMKYVGPENRKAPNGFVNVPSMQQTFRPTHDELVEALKNMGYSSVDINSIAGGPDSWWEPV
jgi:hypothetical protein